METFTVPALVQQRVLGARPAGRVAPLPPRAARGFTLIELMITVAIVAVLAAIALPAYQQYMRKAVYSELLGQMAAVKTAIVECMAVQAAVSKCNDAGLLGISLPGPTAVLASVSINDTNLSIRVAPQAYKGLDPNDYCELAPTIRRRPASPNATIEGWGYSATAPCVQRGYVNP